MLTFRRILISTYMCATILLGFTWVSAAYADNCDTLDKNKAWNTTFEQLNEAYEREDYDKALQYSRELEDICDKSPILNYTIAYVQKKLGNDEKYLFYLTKATQNTERFSVDKDILDQIWSDKYVAAHPDAAPEKIDQLKAENAALSEQLKSAQLIASEAVSLQEEVNNAHAADDAMLWTSVAIGGAGIILTAVGAVLVTNHKSNAVAINGDNEAYVKSNYPMAWGLVGAGLGATVIGAALSGYFGYKFSKNHKNDNTKELSVSITPAYSSLTLSF